MARIALTAELARDLPVGDAVTEYRDSECRGLMLRIYPSGARSWFLWYQSTRRSERVPLGDISSTPLRLARKMVIDRLSILRLPDGRYAPPVGKSGILLDVVSQVGPENITVSTLLDVYLSDVPLAADTLRQYRQLAKAKVAPTLGPRMAANVSRLELSTFGRQMDEEFGGAMANRVYEMLRSAYRHGAAIGLIPSKVTEWDGLPMPNPMVRAKRRRVLLSPEFLRAAWIALEAFDDKRRWQPDAARLLMLTWCRLRQIIGLGRGEIVDLTTPGSARLVIDPRRPGSKRRKRDPDPIAHVVPITDRIGHILKRRLLLARGHALFPALSNPDAAATYHAFEKWVPSWDHAIGCVLEGGRPPKAEAEFSKWWASGRSSGESWHTHDLRSAAMTHSLEELNADLGLMPLMLGHTARQILPAATRVYDRSIMLRQRRELLERWGEWLVATG